MLGKALTQKGDPRAAVAELRRAARLNPTGEAARYQLYRLYLRLGDRESAETELTAFREILAIYGESRNTR